jgi:hypothetical protein
MGLGQGYAGRFVGNHEAERVIQRPKGLAAPRRSSRTGVTLDIAQGGGASAPPFLFSGSFFLRALDP